MYTNRNKHYTIVILRAESAASSRLFCLSALDSTHLTPRSVLCKLFMNEVICLCRYQLVRREESLLSKYHISPFVFYLERDSAVLVIFTDVDKVWSQI